jgi:radical SAM protein with 4Fe4S-binding SPASM domain
MMKDSLNLLDITASIVSDYEDETELNERNYREETLPSKSDYRDIPSEFDPVTQNSIETGYFIFTQMPSLRCKLRCPHCYLSLEQRTSSPIMTVDQLEQACLKVRAYYDGLPHIKNKLIMNYWYGGEPTQMGKEYMLDAFERLDRVFPEKDGYHVRHEILTSLVGVDPSWYDIFKTWGRGHFQSSFDGLMRGKGYMKQWDKKARQAIAAGLTLSTISVVNNDLMKDGAKEVLDYLCDLGVQEASFLPFMLNEQNKGDKYESFAPSMNGYSDFMIELTEYWYEKWSKGEKVPQIGQMAFIASRNKMKNSSIGHNIAGQTLFLLPEGDFVLPDYRDGYLEYMNTFGNIFEQSFEEILTSKARRQYLRKQVTGNHNKDCFECAHKSHCIMEFWKPNREGDDCFGAKRYVDYLLKMEKEHGALSDMTAIMY